MFKIGYNIENKNYYVLYILIMNFFYVFKFFSLIKIEFFIC